MSDSFDWNSLIAEYAEVRAAAIAGRKPSAQYVRTSEAIERFEMPSARDVSRLRDALRDDREKWFVADLARHAAAGVAPPLFWPMLDAGIDEPNPSFNRQFIEPCVRTFGRRRVIERLLDVIDSDVDSRKAGAVNASYWAQASQSISISPPSSTSRADCKTIADLLDRMRRVLLEEFVFNESLDVRRSIVACLPVDPAIYPESHRPLLAKAIEIARKSEDAYIRRRIEVQLGNSARLEPLPHRTGSSGEADGAH